MKSRTLRAWTKWLLIVGMYACILSLLSSEKVQAFSFTECLSNNPTTSVQESLLQLAKNAVELGNNRMKKENAIKIIKIENSKTTSAVMMFTGDLMCLAGQQYSAYKEKKFDFQGSFTYVQPVLSCADLVIGNLETLISESNPYTYQEKMINDSPNCNAMNSYLDALNYAGIHAVITANNHVLDGDKIGIHETIEQLDGKKIAHTGTFKTGEKQQFLLYDINGIKVAILSYTELINRRDMLSAKQVNQYISCYSKEKVEKDVKSAKRCGAEFIVAYNHWGTENTDEVTKRQQEHAQEMAEAGVDLILGSHPHCLQKAEYLATKDGRSVLCLYSLGNFVSSMADEINSDTILLEVNLHKDQNGVYAGAVGYYPIKVLSSYEKQSYVIMPILDHIKLEEKYKKKLSQAKERIQKVIGEQISMIR